MRIGINADEANVENPVGIGQFALNVICELEKIDKKNQYFLYLTSSKKSSLPNERTGWCYKYIWPKKFSTQIALPFNLLLNREKLDVFFTPTHYAPRFCPMPSIISIMDVSYLFYPQYFKKSDLWQLRNWTKYSAENAKKIVTISESTKNDVIKYYGKKTKDVAVCYPGINEKFKEIREIGEIGKIKEKYGIKGKYLIAIGTLQPRKNYERLIRVYAKLKKDGIKEKLVIIGKKGWLFNGIISQVKNLNLEKDVVFTDYISMEDAVVLLQGAEIYVLASLYEGFGIPILEAQACGVPCAVSRVSSIPEVAGEAALYFNPEDEEEMKSTISELLNREELRQNLASKGVKNAQKFTYEKCAKNVLTTIESAVV